MPRQQYDRHAWRCAYQIMDTLHQTRQAVLQDHARWVEPVMEQLPQIARSSNLLTRAAFHSRCGAAVRITSERLYRQLQVAARDIQNLNSQLACESCPPPPSLRDILAELDQLESEFGDWHYDSQTKALHVTTDKIHLEGVELGPFQIRLGVGQPFSIPIGQLCGAQALEPNPAASNDEVTHPHVSAEGICVGDFGPELCRALRCGRICDFFLMIRSILNTYNAHSPYVSLDEWHGEPCSDCGRSTVDDDRYCCEACDRSVCDDCISCCLHCDTSLCYGCVTMCRSCEKSSCAECLNPCIECEDLMCPECIEDDLCPNCLENRDDQDDQEEANETQDIRQEEQAAAQ